MGDVSKSVGSSLVAGPPTHGNWTRCCCDEKCTWKSECASSSDQWQTVSPRTQNLALFLTKSVDGRCPPTVPPTRRFCRSRSLRTNPRPTAHSQPRNALGFPLCSRLSSPAAIMLSGEDATVFRPIRRVNLARTVHQHASLVTRACCNAFHMKNETQGLLCVSVIRSSHR